jgi:hypothetical protein
MHSVNSTGGLHGSFVYYNLGESLTQTLSQGSMDLTQGFIQPPQPTISVAINEGTSGFEIITYPNPFLDNLTLQIKNGPEDLSIRLIDILGRPVPVNFKEADFNEDLKYISINTTLLGKGNYFIHVIDKTKNLRIIKVVKL